MKTILIFHFFNRIASAETSRSDGKSVARSNVTYFEFLFLEHSSSEISILHVFR